MKSEIEVGSDRLKVTRVFEATKQQVFRWWTKAENLQRWSYCKEATSCEVEMDFRVGGSFTQKLMIGPDCGLSITGVYEEILEPDRIVYNADYGGATARVTIDFIEQPGGTRVELTHEKFSNAEACRNVGQGTSESLEVLDSLVATAMSNPG